MRTILLCILISVLSHWAWGQDNLRDSCWQSVSVDTVWTPHEIHMSLWYQQFRPLLDAYKFYEDECRADSTLYWTDIVLTGVADSSYVEPWGWVYSYRTREEKYYTHREPTFAGFREFLERKVKP